jgi:hypothetical protein
MIFLKILKILILKIFGLDMNDKNYIYLNDLILVLKIEKK